MDGEEGRRAPRGETLKMGARHARSMSPEADAAQAEEAEPAQTGPSEEELAAERDLALKERVMTQVLGLVVEAGFPMPKRKAQTVAGHRTFEVEGVTLTVNMILNKIRGDSWRTGADLRKAMDRAWDDIRTTYLGS